MVIANGKREIARVQHIPKPKKGPAALNPILQVAIERAKARQETFPPKIDPVEWIEREFYIPETRRPITLAEYQKKALREALSLDDKGLFRYSTIIWSDIKKSAKTSISAAVVDWLLANMPYASTKFVANDLKQADSRAGRMLATNFKLHPREGVKSTPSGYKIEYPNGSISESVAIDPSGEAGGNDNVVAFDELWGAHEKAKETMWTEMTLSPTKFGKSFRWVSSYAGYLGESNLLWNLYLQGVDQDAQFPGQGKRFDWCYEFDPPLECYYNDAARLFCLWNTVPRLDWQTPAYYAQESTSITITSEFERIHRNRWATAVQSFIPIEWWDACEVDELPPLEEGQYLIDALDGAITFDCFGKVAVSRHGDKLAVRIIKKWSPPKGGSIQFVNLQDPDDPAYPEGAIRQTARKYNVLEFPYDITHIDDMCSRLRRSGVGLFKKFSQNADRKIADKGLHDLIASRGILWSRKTEGWQDLREHMMNANAEVTNEKTMRIVKRAPTLHIDLVVCLSMASARALHYRIG